jgi:Na+-driven multidrug efflux pump
MFEPPAPANPFAPQSSLEKTISYVCLALFLGGLLLWFATDFNRKVWLAMFVGQAGLAILQYRAWRRSKRNAKQADAKS